MSGDTPAAVARAGLDSIDGAQIVQVERIEVESVDATGGQLWVVTARVVVATEPSATGTPAYHAVARLLGEAELDGVEPGSGRTVGRDETSFGSLHLTDAVRDPLVDRVVDEALSRLAEDGAAPVGVKPNGGPSGEDVNARCVRSDDGQSQPNAGGQVDDSAPGPVVPSVSVDRDRPRDLVDHLCDLLQSLKVIAHRSLLSSVGGEATDDRAGHPSTASGTPRGAR